MSRLREALTALGNRLRGDDEESDFDKETRQRALTNASHSVSQFFFPGVPLHFPLKKKVQLARSTTSGVIWDNLQFTLTIFSCIIVFLDAYLFSSHRATRVLFGLELAITQVFVVDFALGTYLRVNPWTAAWDLSCWLDFVTILPAYVVLIFKTFTPKVYLVIYFFRLLRVFRLFKVLRRLAGKNKQILLFGLSLFCFSFFAAGTLIGLLIFFLAAL
jgi:hypothetical protein